MEQPDTIAAGAEALMMGFDAQVSQTHGWGIYAFNVARRLLERGELPVLLCAAPPDISGEAALRIRPAIDYYTQVIGPALRQMASAGRVMTAPFPVLHSLHNDFACNPSVVAVGPHDVGSIFLESCRFSHAGLVRGRRFRRIIAGSQWNARILREIGMEDVVMCHQGVDCEVFFPGPRGEKFGRDRFVVFSGGQLHLRKGQDLVLAAFAAFHRRHPDSLLVAAWHTHWPWAANSLAGSPYLKSLPQLVDNRMDFASWAEAHGLPRSAFLDLGIVPNAEMGEIMRSVDAAVFPNRGEGGTNLVAMECLATGVPTIVADNTGQSDLVAACHTYPLTEQQPVRVQLPDWDMEGWGESSIDEIIDCLERVYTRRDEARANGLASAQVMRNWNWPAKADAIIEAVRAG